MESDGFFNPLFLVWIQTFLICFLYTTIFISRWVGRFLNRYFYNRRFFSSCWVRWFFRSWGINWRSVVFYLLSLGLPLLAYGIQLCPYDDKADHPYQIYSISGKFIEGIWSTWSTPSIFLKIGANPQYLGYKNTWDTTVRRLNPVN